MGMTLNSEISNLELSKDVNISFEKLSYSAKHQDIILCRLHVRELSELSRLIGAFRLPADKKNVLTNLFGEFRARELTVIVGPSGSGKSTLLNLLSGYKCKDGVSGVVKVNGKLRNQRHFRNASSYVMQDSLLHPLLTVREAMKFSVNLKVGDELDDEKKLQRANEILDLLGLTEVQATYTEKLSGGQQKRLSIALELVDNPQIIFFDEPTTGLDSSSASQCLSLLKRLSLDGRTIVCTIHQASASFFKQIDHIYAIAEGRCLYQGSCENLVPFLSELNLVCPEYHNPADYLLEIATHDFGNHNGKLTEKIQEGRNQSFRKSIGSSALHKIDTTKVRHKTAKLQLLKSYCKDSELYSMSFVRQSHFLLIRAFLLMIRNPSMSLMRVGIHLIVAIGIGLLYQGMGNSAKNLMNNFHYITYSVMFLMFTAFSSMQTTFPLEMPVIKREHFNRWYSIRAYFISLTLADIPMQIFCTALYVLVTYLLTGQPLELSRFAAYFLVCLLVCFVAQGIGLLCGSIFNVKYSCILGNFFICPFLIFSGFFVQMKHAPHLTHWLFHISFLKYALEGGVYAIFGFNRKKIKCDDDELNYCRYSYPNQLLRDIGIQDCSEDSTMNCDEYIYMKQKSDYLQAISVLTLIAIAIRTVSYFIMRHRLRS